jgi:formyl-CoA transferase/CoA:oxalate CoA-transferase
MPKPLENLRVLDFSHALAGPYCTMIMAAYGAEVLKVEGTESGEMGRTWGPPFQGGEASYFLGLNTGKKAIALDLKHPRGLDIAFSLIERSDVFIENLRPGSMERLGLGYQEARQRNPRLIYCSISGYGQNGPARDDPAMDLIMQAACGLISVTGSPSGEVARCGHSVADITAGMYALIGILMALHVRNQTGQGQFVDVSMLDSMISAMASNFAYVLGGGPIPKPMGTAFATIVPYGGFPARDRDIVIAAASEKLWLAFTKAIGREDLAMDELYKTNALRVANRNTLEPLLRSIFRQKTAEQWQRIFGEAGVPAMPVRNLGEVVEDVQAAARSMFVEVQHPTAGRVRATGPPLKFSETSGEVLSAAPLHGEHTRQTLSEILEMSNAAVDELLAAGVISDV